MSSLINLNRRAINRNKLFSNSVNKNIDRLKKRLQSSPPKKRFRKSRPLPKPTLNPSPKSDWSLLWTILTILLVLLIVAFIFHFFVQYQFGSVSDRIVDETRSMIERRFQKAPKGVPEVPSPIEGAPISVEEKPDIAGNPYLTLFGAPDAPGFKAGLGKFMGASGTPDVSGFAGFNDAGYPFPGGPSYSSPYNWKKWKPEYARARLGDYYLGAELANVPRYQLNEYIQEQNNYVRSVNDRIKQINEERMYSPKYLRHKAELKELRNFERKLANEVNRETKKQPFLPDRPYN